MDSVNTKDHRVKRLNAIAQSQQCLLADYLPLDNFPTLAISRQKPQLLCLMRFMNVLFADKALNIDQLLIHNVTNTVYTLL